MGSEIVSYMFNGQGVRTVQDGAGKVWFVAKDVAEVLEYTWNGTARIEHVPERWRGVMLVETSSGPQLMAVLSEEGIGFFLMRSDKPRAEPVQQWIAGEVLPSIRHTGAYVSSTSMLQISQATPEPRRANATVQPPSFIYFVRQGEDGPVKVGRSCNVQRRIASLRAASPSPLRLLATTQETNEVSEADIHARFAHLRLKGEWFRPGPELLDFISTVERCA